jgi:hypothetical protein
MGDSWSTRLGRVPACSYQTQRAVRVTVGQPGRRGRHGHTCVVGNGDARYRFRHRAKRSGLRAGQVREAHDKTHRDPIGPEVIQLPA